MKVLLESTYRVPRLFIKIAIKLILMLARIINNYLLNKMKQIAVYDDELSDLIEEKGEQSVINDGYLCMALSAFVLWVLIKVVV